MWGEVGQPMDGLGLTAKVLATDLAEEEVAVGSGVSGWFSFDEELRGE